jgi:hypothetical protein
MKTGSKLGWVLAFAMAWCGACVATPYDGEIISQAPTTTIPVVAGFTIETNVTIKILAKNSSGGWEQLATATPDTGRSWSWAGSTWYRWGIDNLNVPQRFWVGSSGAGAVATLKATTTSAGDYTSLKSAFGGCWVPTDSLQQFLDRCRSPASPEVHVKYCGAFGCP